MGAPFGGRRSALGVVRRRVYLRVQLARSAVLLGSGVVAVGKYCPFMTSVACTEKGMSMATVIQAYRFALDPTPRQQRALASHCGAARFAYNWGLELVKTRLDQRQTDSSVVVPWKPFDLRREWDRAKREVAPWWAENSKEAYKSGLEGLAKALKNWSDSKSGRRMGRPVNFPRFKKKGRARDACRFTTGPLKVLPDRKHIQLPRIGVLKTHESTRKLARRLEQGSARIMAATITRTADRWHVSFTVEVQRHLPAGNGSSTVVGVDVGVRYLAVLSTGTVIANPRALETARSKLRRLDRQLARRSPDSKGRRLTQQRLARVHMRAANLRRDSFHRLTTALATEYGTVVVERLNMAGMLRNRRLARVLADAGLAELRRQLTYKTAWYGSRLVVADRFYPSSKSCSTCGWVKAKLTPAERIFTCEACGLRIDRDLNAAHNLSKLAQHVAQSGWETQNARGADISPGPLGRTAMKREASNPPRA
jgi:putative transposase